MDELPRPLREEEDKDTQREFFKATKLRSDDRLFRAQAVHCWSQRDPEKYM